MLRLCFVLLASACALPTDLLSATIAQPGMEMFVPIPSGQDAVALAQMGSDFVHITVDQSRCVNLCSGRGKCVVNNAGTAPPDNTTICICDAGWTGNDCSSVMLPPHAQSHGIPCPNNCSSHGICFRGSSVVLPRCYCDPHWAGADCSQLRPSYVTCKNNCNGFGVCTVGYSDHHQSIIATCQCDNKHAGDDCSIERSSTCPRGCSGHGKCTGNGCVCDTGFTGLDCSLQPLVYCPMNCSSHGRCVNGQCFCFPGFEGQDCSQAPKFECDIDCGSHGHCVPGTPYFPAGCRCDPKWYGRNCTFQQQHKVECMNNCTGHGRCRDDAKCECEALWVGEDCSFPAVVIGVNATEFAKNTDEIHPLLMDGPSSRPDPNDPSKIVTSTVLTTCPNNCSSHGVCHHFVYPYRVSVCECDPGYSKEDCSLAPPSNIGFAPSTTAESLLLPQPSQQAKQPSQMISEDHTSWDRLPSAEEIKVRRNGCVNNCSSRGRCIVAAEGKKTCSCYNGWGGADCSTKVSMAEKCTLDCSGHGRCVTASQYFPIRCLCDDDWTGEHCDVPKPKPLVYELQDGLCPNHCSMRGPCVNGQCVCMELGYGGPDCSVLAGGTCEQNCNGNGLCFWGVCECIGGYTGKSCDQEPPKPCPNNCNMRGKCVGGQCICLSGWTGDDCNDMMIECPRHCSGHGQCQDADLNEAKPAMCKCQEGWTGSDCSNFPLFENVPGMETEPTKSQQYYGSMATQASPKKDKKRVKR